MIKKPIYLEQKHATEIIKDLQKKDLCMSNFDRSDNAKKVVYNEFVNIIEQYSYDYIKLLDNHNIDIDNYEEYNLDGLYNLYKYYLKSLKNDFIVTDITQHFISERVEDFIDFVTYKIFL